MHTLQAQDKAVQQVLLGSKDAPLSCGLELPAHRQTRAELSPAPPCMTTDIQVHAWRHTSKQEVPLSRKGFFPWFTNTLTVPQAATISYMLQRGTLRLSMEKGPAQ